jgi:hypothetical protein
MAGRTINVEQQVEKDRPQINFRSSNIRHQWLRDFPKTLDRSGIRSTLGRLPIKSSGACALGCCALRGSDRFTPTVSIRQRQDELNRT